MNVLDSVRNILRQSLGLGAKADLLTLETSLLGGLPEFDSMAVVTVVTMIEDQYDITISDDELSADVFGTVGSLVQFVAEKTGS